jgi:hypothetical protein
MQVEWAVHEVNPVVIRRMVQVEEEALVVLVVTTVGAQVDQALLVLLQDLRLLTQVAAAAVMS